MSPDPELIPPRTDKERQAYVGGWMDALKMVESDGLAAARAWTGEMAQMELDLIERKRNAAN